MKLLYYNTCPLSEKTKGVKEYLHKGGEGSNAIEAKRITPQNRSRTLNDGAKQVRTNLVTGGISSKCVGECAWVIF